jgi:hypothetical protein
MAGLPRVGAVLPGFLCTLAESCEAAGRPRLDGPEAYRRQACACPSVIAQTSEATRGPPAAATNSLGEREDEGWEARNRPHPGTADSGRRSRLGRAPAGRRA